MAGDVWLSQDERWLANNSLYNWVLDFLIDSVSDPAAVAALEEVRDANIGLVNLADFDPETQRDILVLLSERLVPDAMSRLRPDMPGRDDYIASLQELADLASTRDG